MSLEGSMITVHKYPISAAQGDVFTIEMPAGAKILHFAMQGPVSCVWAEVDKRWGMSSRRFVVIGTGWELPMLDIGVWTHRGTLLAEGVGLFGDRGHLVWHLFEATL